FIQSYAAQREFPAFVKEMVSGEITKELFKLVKPIYPVRRVEIIKSRVEPEATAAAGTPPGEPVEEKGEEKPEPKPEEKAVAPAQPPAPAA
ncbi:MAG: hypothetical protein LUQ49_04750, partial [Methanomicrobiales archaeon]|nr:hypothetical protein [Methanomicrobiales archaeon]